jgi:hypothetical protein
LFTRINFDYSTWEPTEKLRFVRGVLIWGTDFAAIAETICLKEVWTVRALYHHMVKDSIVPELGAMAKDADYRSAEGRGKFLISLFRVPTAY